MEAKDNELLAALRKNATLTEELSQLRQQQQRLLDSGASAAAAAAARGGNVLGAASAGLTGAGGDEGSGFDASSVTGSMGLMQSRHGPGSSVMQGVAGSQQLLGSYVASEPGGHAAQRENRMKLCV